MYAIHLGKWDNYPESSEEREKELQQVLAAINEYGKVSISFDYEGRTRHETAAHKMASRLPAHFEKEIGYNYHFTVVNPNVELNEAFLRKLELVEGIAIIENGEELEIEAYTNGKVNMFHLLDKSKAETLQQQFVKIVEDFDIDSAIWDHRQSEHYRENFSTKRSQEDFEEYVEWLKEIIEKVK